MVTQVRINETAVAEHLDRLWEVFPALKTQGNKTGVLALCDLGLARLNQISRTEFNENKNTEERKDERERISRQSEPSKESGKEFAECGVVGSADPVVRESQGIGSGCSDADEGKDVLSDFDANEDF